MGGGDMAEVFKAAGQLEVAQRSVQVVGEELREIHVTLSKIPKKGADAQCWEEAIERNILEIRRGVRLLQLQLDAIRKLTKPKA